MKKSRFLAALVYSSIDCSNSISLVLHSQIKDIVVAEAVVWITASHTRFLNKNRSPPSRHQGQTSQLPSPMYSDGGGISPERDIYSSPCMGLAVHDMVHIVQPHTHVRWSDSDWYVDVWARGKDLE